VCGGKKMSSTSVFAIFVVVGFVCVSSIGLAIWNQYNSTSADSRQDTKLSDLNTKQQNDVDTIKATFVILNSTLYAQVGETMIKIAQANSTLSNEFQNIYSNLTFIYNTLNISSGNASSFFSVLNNTIITISGDINNLQVNITDIYNNVTVIEQNVNQIYNNLSFVWMQLDNLEVTKLETINGVSGDSVTKNINLVSANDNMQILVGPGVNTITFNVSEAAMKFVNENGTVVPDAMGQVFAHGDETMLVDVKTTTPHTLILDCSSLQTNLNNKDAMIMQQNAIIVNLTSNVNSLENRVTNLETIIQTLLNITISANGTNVTFSFAQLISNITTLQNQVQSLETQVANINANTSAVPVGTIVPFGGEIFSNMTAVPIGYLLCDGSVKLIASYPALHMTIGTAYCGVNVSYNNLTEFCVPDLRGRVPAGQKSSGNFGSRAQYLGEETHTLTTNEMPAHSHSVNSISVPEVTSTGNTFTFEDITLRTSIDNFQCIQPAWRNIPSYSVVPTFLNTLPIALVCLDNYNYDIPNNMFYPTPNLQYNNEINTRFEVDGINVPTHNTNSFGSGAAHNNIQPSVTINYIIKY